ncbi:MAG: AIDA repeat-containing protein, partial [Lentisphaeria bacterium]|nr:AIDA repeat-containing protein [Lentisphaeria bacterium]
AGYTTINSGGTMIATADINDTTVNNGGRMSVGEGGVATYTRVNSGGSAVITSGATASGTDVHSGGGTYNAYCTWIVDNPVDWRMVSVADPAEWDFLCSGDFDGNGSHDIAMINNVGVVGIWGVNDGYLSSWSILSAVTFEWTLAGVADFNGDGTDDIAWSNCDTGLTGYWQINDKTLTTWQNIAVIG